MIFFALFNPTILDAFHLILEQLDSLLVNHAAIEI